MADLRCRGCGRYRRTHVIADTQPDDRYADFTVKPCPHCQTDTAASTHGGGEA